MKIHQVSDHCYALINENNRVCDANSELIHSAAFDTIYEVAMAKGIEAEF